MTDSPLNRHCRKLLNDLEGYAPENALPVMALTMKALEQPEEAGLHFPNLDLWLEDALLLEASDLARGRSPEAIRALAGAEVEDHGLDVAEQIVLEEITGKPPMEAAGILASRLYQSLRPKLQERWD